VAMLVDVTHRRHMEQALLASEERHRGLVDAIPGYAVVSVGLDGVVRTFSRGAESLTGLRAAEVVGRPLSSLSAVQRTAEQDAELLARALREGPVRLVDTWNVHHGQLLELECTLARMTDTSGSPNGLVCVAQDLTLVRRREQQVMQDARVQALRALGAHISGTAGAAVSTLLLQDAWRQQPLGAAVGQLLAAAQGWSAFHLAATPVWDRVDLRVLLERAAAMLALGDLVQLQVTGPCVVPGDASLLSAALLAVLRNAMEARPGGRISVTVSGIDVRNPALPLKDGPHVRVCIRDEGPGIPPALRTRVTEPFVSGRPGCAGLGLWKTQRVVAYHGGALALDSREGEGTSVFIYLPSAVTEAAPPAEHAALRGRVVVALADRMLSDAVCDALRRREHSVVQAPDTHAARAQLQEKASVLLADPATLAVLGAEAGGARVVVTVQPAPAEAEQAGVLVLPVPFGQEQLATVVKRALRVAAEAAQAG